MEYIHEAIDQLAHTLDQAVLLACGIQLWSDSDTEDETYDNRESMVQDNPVVRWAHADILGGEKSKNVDLLPGGEQSKTSDHIPGEE